MVKGNNRRNRTRMKGGAVDFDTVEINNTGCSTSSECATEQMAKQDAGANEQINMKNQMGGSQSVVAQEVDGSSDQDAALQQQIQKTAYQGQANAEFDNNAGKIGGRRRKRRKSRKSRKSRKRRKSRKSRKRRKSRKSRKSRKRRKSKKRK